MRRDAAFAVAAAVAAAAALRRRRRTAAPQPATSPAPAMPRPASPPTPAEAAAPRFLSVGWALVEAPAERAALTIAYELDERVQLDRVDVRETPTQVFITVLVRAAAPAARPHASATRAEATVPLSRPLGSRELIHAPTDPGEATAAPVYP
jgi:hypothetical protein